MIDLLLINPNSCDMMAQTLRSELSAIEPPVWTAQLAAVVREMGYTVQIVDADAAGLSCEEIAQKCAQVQPRFVGVSALGANPSASSTPKMPAIRLLLQELRKVASESKTFLYGIHPSALPELTLREEYIDFVIRGEVFRAVPRLLSLNAVEYSGVNIPGVWYLVGNEVYDGGWAELVEALDELPLPAWDLLPMHIYRAHNWHCFDALRERTGYAAVFTSLGCPFHCDYCNIHALYDGKSGVRTLSVAHVISEIDELVKRYEVKNIKIIDELFVLKKERVEALCDGLIERKYDLNIWAYARVDTVDAELLKKMKRAGFSWLCYGIESANSDVRRKVAKGQFTANTINQAVQMTKAAGIHVIGNFLFGLPHDTYETMEETLQLACDLMCEYVNFYVCMAYPGSLMYAEVLESDGGYNVPWGAYAQLSCQTRPLGTKSLNPAEVLVFRDTAFSRYVQSEEYLKYMGAMFGEEIAVAVQKMSSKEMHRNLLKGSNDA